jgi:hypothetical protein
MFNLNTDAFWRTLFYLARLYLHHDRALAQRHFVICGTAIRAVARPCSLADRSSVGRPHPMLHSGRQSQTIALRKQKADEDQDPFLSFHRYRTTSGGCDSRERVFPAESWSTADRELEKKLTTEAAAILHQMLQGYLELTGCFRRVFRKWALFTPEYGAGGSARLVAKRLDRCVYHLPAPGERKSISRLGHLSEGAGPCHCEFHEVFWWLHRERRPWPGFWR